MGSLNTDRILAELADARVALAKAADDVRRLKEYVGTLELAARLAGAPLTSIRPHRSVSPVDVNAAAPLDAYTKRAATRATRTHEGLRLLYEQNVTQASLARELGETRSRVASWFATGEGNRPIPRRHVAHLLTKYGVPETVWERVA